MSIRTFLSAMIFIVASVLVLPHVVLAEAVGHLTQVEGRVDLLKGGKLPATPVKVGDGVEKGDVLRTKSLSKAQITFIDNSTLTISPESRIGIEEYMVDAAKGKRNALLQVFQGMVLAVVSKIYQKEQPDFVVKTHTAIMGIRGTEVGIRLAPNSSSFLNFQGLTRVSNAFPEISGTVELKAMEATEVFRGLPPTLPQEIGPEDRKLFMHQFDIANLIRMAPAGEASSGGAGGGDSSKGGGTSSASSGGSKAVCTSAAATSCGSSSTITSAGASTVAATPAVLNVVINPPPPPPPPSPKVTTTTTTTSQSYSFSQIFAGSLAMTTNSSFTTATFNFDSPGQGVRAGDYKGNFYIDMKNSFITATATKGIFNQLAAGEFWVRTNTLKLTGSPGGTLTGTMRLVGTIGGGFTPTNFIFRSGLITLLPNGDLLFKGKGIFKIGGTRGTALITWLQHSKK